MMNYWSNLSDKERWYIIIGASCTLIYIFYLFIYSPLTTALSTKSKFLKEKTETLVWMKDLRQQPKKDKEPQTISDSKLLSLIASQLNESSFKKFPFQLQQTGQGDIQLSFDNVPYNLTLSWLWRLTSDYAIVLKQFTAERTETEGVVKMVIILAAKN